MKNNQSIAIDVGINEAERKKIADGLAKILADTYTVYLKTHNFHWNVTGPMFQTLHLMFEAQYNEMWTAIDVIAERIRSLGEFAPGSYTAFSKLTSIAETDGVPKAEDMLRILVDNHESIIKAARQMYPLLDQAGDEASSDLLTQRIQIHEKTAWMLRSLLG